MDVTEACGVMVVVTHVLSDTVKRHRSTHTVLDPLLLYVHEGRVTAS